MSRLQAEASYLLLSAHRSESDCMKDALQRQITRIRLAAHSSHPHAGRAFNPVQAVANTRRGRVQERHERLRRKVRISLLSQPLRPHTLLSRSSMEPPSDLDSQYSDRTNTFTHRSVLFTLSRPSSLLSHLPLRRLLMIQ